MEKHYSEHGKPHEMHMASAPAGHAVHTHEAAHDGHSSPGHGKRHEYATGKSPFHSGEGKGRGEK